MKTRNQNQKTTLALLVAAAVTLFFTCSAEAQHLWKNSSEIIDSNTIVAEITDEVHLIPALKVSRLNNNYFSANEIRIETETYLTAAVENKLKLENWMTSNDYFATETYLTTAVENKLKLENWMTDSKTFVIHAQPTAENDETITLENWLFIDFYSLELTEKEKPLKLEDWMTDKNCWK